jgi:hypothetical protein
MAPELSPVYFLASDISELSSLTPHVLGLCSNRSEQKREAKGALLF